MLEEKKKRDPFRNFVIGVIAVTAVLLLVLPGSSLIQAGRAFMETRRDKALIRECRQRTEEIERQIRQLKSDPDTLEKFAREQFLFAAPGDDVYVIGE
ncbi:MAG: septum formation initiator family protein [Candidatus Cryptobacteroides sp.]|nr:septum formation initiator family protein [Bacteroidales bacterium]MDD7531440.1 septum formation initiator family protein [Bacteroidales bacterium]MDY4631280.1 septum formation initiator family protein [Candidatus Cryptobacteroides sp.]MDY5743278.1 septum formation initiator family protein [Candidatus Cryptobacteroides sp.]